MPETSHHKYRYPESTAPADVPSDMKKLAEDAEREADKIQAARSAEKEIGAGAIANVTLTWPTAFADTSYTVVASVVEASGELVTVQVISRTKGGATFLLINKGESAAKAFVHAIAVHD